MNMALLLSVIGMNQWLTFSNANIQLSVISNMNELNENNTSLVAIQDFIPDPVDKPLSRENLTDIFKISKNISHSKGHLTKNKDGGIEYKRSLKQKIFESASALALKKWLDILETNSSAQLLALDELEFLVHQYETAINFKNLGGIDIIFSYVYHENLLIASGALSVLTAAMQGNPEIQEYVEKFHIIEYLLEALSPKNYSSVSGLLYTLSSYLRNMPSHQAEFFSSNGLKVLREILRQNSNVRYKVRVIGLIGDLANEIYAIPENDVKKDNLPKLFAMGIMDNNICDEIPHYLQLKDYILNENIVAAMNALSVICYDEFHKEYIMESIEKLKDYYNPNKNGALHSSIDKELKINIHKDLNILFENIATYKEKRISKKIEL